MKLIEGTKYSTSHGVLTYAGFSSGIFYRCDGCDKSRKNIHEFLLGDFPRHTSSYHYGSECIKKFLVEAKLEEM